MAVAFEKPTPIGLSLRIDSEPDGLIAAEVTTGSGEKRSFAFSPLAKPSPASLSGSRMAYRPDLWDLSDVGTGTPAMPRTSHPARPRVVGGDACSVCPENGNILSAIDS